MAQAPPTDPYPDLAGPFTRAEFRRSLQLHHPELSLRTEHDLRPGPGFLAFVVRTHDPLPFSLVYVPSKQNPAMYVRVGGAMAAAAHPAAYEAPE